MKVHQKCQCKNHDITRCREPGPRKCSGLGWVEDFQKHPETSCWLLEKKRHELINSIVPVLLIIFCSWFDSTRQKQHWKTTRFLFMFLICKESLGASTKVLVSGAVGTPWSLASMPRNAGGTAGHNCQICRKKEVSGLRKNNCGILWIKHTLVCHNNLDRNNVETVCHTSKVISPKPLFPTNRRQVFTGHWRSGRPSGAQHRQGELMVDRTDWGTSELDLSLAGVSDPRTSNCWKIRKKKKPPSWDLLVFFHVFSPNTVLLHKKSSLFWTMRPGLMALLFRS